MDSEFSVVKKIPEGNFRLLRNTTEKKMSGFMHFLIQVE